MAPRYRGVAATLARPGGNITGVFLDFPDFTAKWMEMLVESNPKVSRAAVLWDPITGTVQVESVKKADEIRNCAQHANCSRAGDIHSYVAFLAGRRGDRMSAPAASWCDPAGGSPAQVRGSARLVASVAWPLATVVTKRTQRLHGVWDR